jgi:hypothetical protein
VRLGELRKLGKITFDQYGLMVVLREMANPRTRTATFASIEVLRRELGWGRTGQERDESTLRSHLRKLRSLGEIEFDSKQGQRGDLGRGWSVLIVPEDYWADGPSPSSEVTSDHPNVGGGPKLGSKQLADTGKPRTNSAVQLADTDTEEEIDEDVEEDLQRSE